MVTVLTLMTVLNLRILFLNLLTTLFGVFFFMTFKCFLANLAVTLALWTLILCKTLSLWNTFLRCFLACLLVFLAAFLAAFLTCLTTLCNFLWTFLAALLTC